MSDAPGVGESMRQSRAIDSPWVKGILGTLSTALFIAALFWAAGRIDWIAGWVYIGLVTLGQGATGIYLWRKDPELIRRRGVAGDGTKGWDKVVLGIFGLTYAAVPFIAAADAGRFGWTTLPWWLWFVGCALYGLGVVIVARAMSVNTHFEKTVRIQKDRDHRVIDVGPYAIIRHPGYVGAALSFPLAAPLLLGSAVAFIPAIICVSTLVVRTALEDRTLHRELNGYQDYARRVRYRLVPGLW